MPPKQTQKQKQTVIVNIGSTVIKRKRKKRTTKPKSKRQSVVTTLAYQEAVQGSLPPFIRTAYPVTTNIKQDQTEFQLASVTEQLKNLQNKQLHVTGNLMSAEKAIARDEAAQGSIVELPAPSLAPPVEASPAAAPKTRARRTKIEMTEAFGMMEEDKPKPKSKRQTKAEQVANMMYAGGGLSKSQRTELLGGEGSGMSSITMTPGMLTPKPVMTRPKLVIRKPFEVPTLASLSSTPETMSLSGMSMSGGASDATAPRF
jgi:hypothetical protein